MSQPIIVGCYTVRLGIRADNPAFPAYLVYRDATFIGKQFSMPSVSDCEWMEQNGGRYARSSAQPGNRDYALRGGRTTKRLWMVPEEVPE